MKTIYLYKYETGNKDSFVIQVNSLECTTIVHFNNKDYLFLKFTQIEILPSEKMINTNPYEIGVTVDSYDLPKSKNDEQCTVSITGNDIINNLFGVMMTEGIEYSALLTDTYKMQTYWIPYTNNRINFHVELEAKERGNIAIRLFYKLEDSLTLYNFYLLYKSATINLEDFYKNIVVKGISYNLINLV